MTVGALLDLGLPLDAVREAVTALGLTHVDLEAERVERSSITATKFHVHLRHEHAHADHEHRAYAVIRDLIERSTLAARVKDRALAIFGRLAEAEARVHGVAPEEVEFHEVGAVDAIVDVVGAALGFTHLAIDAVHVSPLPMGPGRVSTAHGPLPVPGPAVVELLRGWPVRFEDGATELVTPTG